MITGDNQEVSSHNVRLHEHRSKNGQHAMNIGQDCHTAQHPSSLSLRPVKPPGAPTCEQPPQQRVGPDQTAPPSWGQSGTRAPNAASAIPGEDNDAAAGRRPATARGWRAAPQGDPLAHSGDLAAARTNAHYVQELRKPISWEPQTWSHPRERCAGRSTGAVPAPRCARRRPTARAPPSARQQPGRVQRRRPRTDGRRGRKPSARAVPSPSGRRRYGRW